MISPAALRPNSQGFSSVELLVAVAVLVVLIALLIPAGMRSKERALQATCAGQLRQIGMAINLYASENQDHLPGPEFSIVNLKGHLVLKLEPYLRSSKVWRCPANPTMQDDFSTYRTRTPLFGYYYAPPKESLVSYRRLQIQETYPPADRWIMEDIDAWNYAAQPRIGRGVEGPVHPGRRNVLFLDGHVEDRKVKAP
ncbi:MAG TPA: H-X9-DG-CTERM domain-containing protein [Chthoniobacteraceae bacterium]|nr:H-X9-DG-CTERM domain-containing protein [Chthoniobacteraceae bacterium]